MDHKFNISKLKGSENYEIWALRMQSLLIKENCWTFSGTPADPSKPAENAEKALALIRLAIEDGPLLQIRNFATPSSAWDGLKKLYSPKGFSSEFLIFKEFFDTTLANSNNSVEDYINTITRLTDNLDTRNLKLPDKLIMAWVLNHLTPEYEGFVSNITQSYRIDGAQFDLPGLFSNLLDESRRLSYKDGNSQQALAAAKSNRPKCTHCKKPGHHIDKCYQLHPELKPQENNQEVVTLTEVILPAVETAMPAFALDSWILDSGATTHICCNKAFFRQIKSTDTKVKWGAASTIQASGVGAVPLKLPNSTTVVILQDCLYIPEFQTNLVSLGRLIRNGAKIGFNTKQCDIQLRNGTNIKAVLVGGLYKLPLQTTLHSDESEIALSSVISPSLWHQRLGHIGSTGMRHLSSSVQGLGLTSGQNLSPVDTCETCLKGKFTAHPNHSAANTKYTVLFSHISTDLCGPMPVVSYDGYRYFIAFVCSATKWLEVRLLTSKAGALKAFQDFRNLVQNRSGNSIQTIRSDWGSEFENHQFAEYLAKHGITHEHSAPYSHEQNGQSERLNRTILDKARCLLFQAQMSKKYWSEAVLAAAYLYNYTPHSAIDYKTPYQARFGDKPSVAHIKIFGSLVYSKTANIKKLDEKSKQGHLVGFGTNQFKILDTSRNRAFWARDATVLEGRFDSTEGLSTEDLMEFDVSSGNDTSSENNTSSRNDISSPSTPEISTNPIQAGSENPSEEGSQSDQEASPERIIQTRSRSKLPVQNTQDSGSEDELAFLSGSFSPDPQSYRDACASPNIDYWQKAMEKELADLAHQKTWNLVELPPGAHLLRGRWVYKTKIDKNGNIEKYKARWVVKGFLQKYGIDYVETFSNTVKPMAYKTLFALAAYRDLEIQQWDVKSAFPNAPLDEKIYVEQPHGFQDQKYPTRACLLNKALYGLKQSARQWYIYLAKLLSELGYIPITSDQSIFINKSDGVIVTSHIDDLLIFGPDIRVITSLREALGKKVEVSDLGEVSYYLGIEVTRNRASKLLYMSQQKFIEEILQRFGKTALKPTKTPAEQGIRLEKYQNAATEADIKLFQQQIGSLMYLMTSTRPDLSFAIGQCARFMSNPAPEHFKALNRIWQYLNYSKNLTLRFCPQKLSLQGFVDADWGGDYTTRKSTTGYLFLFGGSAVSWSSKLQKTVALSSCEAEYMALKEGIKEQIWLKSLYEQLDIPQQDGENMLFSDSQSAIELAKNPEHHARTKHIDIQYHFVRQNVQNETIKLSYISTSDQPADGLTKALDSTKFGHFVKCLGLSI